MKDQKGFSLIELLIVVAIIGIIAAIAIPNLIKSRQAANDASAFGSVRTIGTAQATYQSTKGTGINFGNTLVELGNTPGNEGLIDSTLAAGAKSGFNFAMTGVAAVGGGAPSYFDTTANAQSCGTFGTGTKSVSSNETYVIWATLCATPAAVGAAPPGDRTPAGMNPIQ